MTIQDNVRVPPSKFGSNLEGTILNVLKQQYEGYLNKELGLVVSVTSIENVGEGVVRPGDGSAHYDTTFNLISFMPQQNEIVLGKVIEIVEFGAFVTLGAIDGLVHVSQVTDDFLSYDEKGRKLVGKESKKSVIEGDMLRARIVALSMKKSQNQKVGLTMRQMGLGKLKWLEEDKKKAEKDKKEAEKKPKTSDKKEKKGKKK
ncbi:DNA-directed RNA polymerase [Candidatus Undinarchaeota archaeon]